MNLLFTPEGWEDYVFWQNSNKQILKKINKLLEDILRNPESGAGKPERLKWGLAGCWSRRINFEHRLVYKMEKNNICIISCRYHY